MGGRKIYKLVDGGPEAAARLRLSGPFYGAGFGEKAKEKDCMKNATNLLEGSIDWCKVKAALDNAGYQGYLTAEVDTFHRTPEYQYEITKMALDHIISL